MIAILVVWPSTWNSITVTVLKNGFSTIQACGFGLLISFFYCFFCSGFCAPIDVHAFTCELKNKLSAKCRGKDETYFTRAVKEICEEYDGKGTKKENFMPEIDDGKSTSWIDERLKYSTNK